MNALTRPFWGIGGGQSGLRAQLLIDMLDAALAAPDITRAVSPALEILVLRTAAAGAAYFQVTDRTFVFVSGSGRVPSGHNADALLAFGLPAESSLVQALIQNPVPIFATDIESRVAPATLIPMEVVSLAAAPVLQRDGTLLGMFLAYTPKKHRWSIKERRLFEAVTSTMAALIVRLVVEEDAIRALAVMVDGRDVEIKGHAERVARLAARLGKALGLDKDTLLAIRQGAYLHDLGKIFIPDAILNKPGRLDGQEWQIMKQHAETGHQVAQELSFLPRAALDVVLYHHERWDGDGYPYGLAGDAIPLTARLFALCDVYDALTSLRPYKVAWSKERALSEIQMLSGTRFDPEIVNKFMQLFPPE